VVRHAALIVDPWRRAEAQFGPPKTLGKLPLRVGRMGMLALFTTDSPMRRVVSTRALIRFMRNYQFARRP
jgi:hypothetical protein